MNEELQPIRVIEAALFIANKPLSLSELAEAINASKEKVIQLLQELRQEYDSNENAFEIALNEAEENAVMQVRSKYLGRVSSFSKKIDLSRKATRILALVAKKKQLLQKDLKHYFRGEIYAYVTELKQAGYIEAEKHGNTRLLKPTKKFFEYFQLSE